MKKKDRPYVIPPPTLAELGILKQEERGYLYRSFRIFAVTTFFLSVLAGIGTFFWLQNLGAFSVSNDDFKSVTNHREQDNSIVFDRSGAKIGEYFRKYHFFVPFDDLPKSLVQAIIATEDRNFFNHFGIDPKAIARAIKVVIKGGGHFKQGASTITQQVVRHFLLTKEKTLHRKVKEMVLAVRLEQVLGKKRILEIYANSLFLGNGAYGVGAAAQRFFGKKLAELEVHEFALLAGLFQSPSRYNPHKYPKKAKNRQRQVLRAMFQAGFLTKRAALNWSKKPLEYKTYKSMNELLAPYFLDYVRDQAQKVLGYSVFGRGLRIYTTLDTELQTLANETFSSMQPHFEKADSLIRAKKNLTNAKHRAEGALLSVDPKTGEILAMVGGRNYQSSQFNRTIQSKRSPGSAFKPIVYSLALQHGKRWSDLLFVSPVSIGGYRPKDFSGKYLTETTMLRAFYQSLNTATIEIGSEIGLDIVLDHARKLGVQSPLKREPGSMLGSSEMTMSELAGIYSGFANNGVYSKPIGILKITDRDGKVVFQQSPNRIKRVMPAKIAYLTVQGMRAVMLHGTAAKAGHLAPFAAGKTGTSNNAIDNWFAGFNPNLLTVVWVGTDKQIPMDARATGGTMALPIWTRFMEGAFKLRKPEPFTRPKGLTTASVHPRYGYRTGTGMTMYFLRENPPTRNYSEFEAVGSQDNFRDVFSH